MSATFSAFRTYRICFTCSKEHLDETRKHQEEDKRMQVYLCLSKLKTNLCFCAGKVLEAIVGEIYTAYYYDCIVYGTPDVIYTDHLTFIVR